MSHTKGPWLINIHQSVNSCYVGPQNCQSLASLSFTFRDKGRVMADAHLIAAAPDLLEACEFALETFREWVELGRAKSELNALDGTPIILTEADCCQLFEEIEQVLFQVGRAHAKAKGETDGR